jgi:hypothetical protein
MVEGGRGDGRPMMGGGAARRRTGPKEEEVKRRSVATRNEQELKALTQNYRNRILQFGKLEGPILSGPTAVRGVVGL